MAWSKVLLVIVLAAYPVFVYFGLDHFDVRTVALIIVGVALLRLGLGQRAAAQGAGGVAMPKVAALVLTGALLAAGAWVIVSRSADLLLYYPVMVNGVFFFLFFQSLLFPPTVVERIARLQTPDLPAEGVRYTRKVTIVWCGFFVVNGSMALATALSANLEFWAVYNSAVSYGLMGLLFAGEYLVRRRVQRRYAARTASRGWS